MVSRLLLYPFMLMIVLDIFALGTTQTNFGSSGSLTVGNQGVSVAGITPGLPQTCYDAADGVLLAKIYNTIFNVNCPPTGITPGQPLPAAYGGLTFFSVNPFKDPLGFASTILVILGAITIGGIAIFGTSFLNAATEYILFISITTILTWVSLLNAGASMFTSFPCYSYTTLQLLFSCPTNASGLPILNNILYTGYLFELILTLSVLMGIVDLVAL